jgi:galactokinase
MSTVQTNPPESALSNFAAAFRRTPVWAVSAPGRVNLIGEHLDYNDGFVLPAAINRYVTMIAAPIESHEIRIRTHHYKDEAVIDLANPPSPNEMVASWMRYPLGVLAGFQRTGAQVPGMAVWIESSVPLGGGLSSSAALEVAFATLIEEAADYHLPPKQKALLCQRAEHEFVGVPCGLMDQFTSVLGRQDHLLRIDCRSMETTPVPFQDTDVTLLIANTNVRHSLASGEYAKRKEECDRARKRLGAPSWRHVSEDDLADAQVRLEDVLFRRARHVVSETKRTLEAVEAIRKGEWDRLGELMYASHESLAKDYEVSCEELDTVVEIAREIGAARGVLGARMTGGGFGGSTVTLVRAEHAETVMSHYIATYSERTKHTLEAFVTRPMGGAQSHKLTNY